MREVKDKFGRSKTNPQGIRNIRFSEKDYRPYMILVTPKKNIFAWVSDFNPGGFQVRTKRGNQEFVWEKAYELNVKQDIGENLTE